MKIKKYYKFVLVSLIVFFVFYFGRMTVQGIGTYLTGYKVPPYTTDYVVQYFLPPLVNPACGWADNNTSSNIFVPTKTSTEWNNFADSAGFTGCDNDGVANSGLTTWKTTTICGSWDWNCDGVITKSKPTIASDTTCSTLNQSCDSGYRDSIPACGVSGTYQYGTCTWYSILLGFQCDAAAQTQSCH